ncbi:MAG: hypothetical protein OEX12_00125 [Gammaproteobacteria bacterium]|nr:hypothetical protein [Gammaproteobacteria bacterium]
MSHISSIGAGMFSDLAICRDTTEVAAAIANPSEANFKACFATELANGSPVTVAAGEFTRIKNIREFPAMGTPPNVVNVPVYGQKTSSQIQGQSDAPSMEIQMNYVGTEWQDAADYLGSLVGDGLQYVFRFALLNAEPESGFASAVGELGAVENSQYFWIGKMEAIQVNPQLTDSNTATVTITVQSDFYGAFTS